MGGRDEGGEGGRKEGRVGGREGNFLHYLLSDLTMIQCHK